ncbi:MAG: hypothetical protein AAGG75_08345 [Bacteroidota bacterium]
MAYSSRRKYTSRRERYARNKRHIRMVFIFAVVAAIVLLYKNRVAIFDWLRYAY